MKQLFTKTIPFKNINTYEGMLHEKAEELLIDIKNTIKDELKKLNYNEIPDFTLKRGEWQINIKAMKEGKEEKLKVMIRKEEKEDDPTVYLHIQVFSLLN